MKREHSLRGQLHSLESLSEAVGAMKSLAAHHFRSARSALTAAREYRDGIDQVLATIGFHQPGNSGDVAAILLIAADLGLCDGYNSQLSSAAIDHHRRLNAQRVYSVGHRSLPVFHRADISVDREYSAPASVIGLTELLLQLSEDLLNDYLNGRFDTLYVVSARFDGVGEFTPVCTRLLPVETTASVPAIKPSTYVTADHLAAVAVREYLYIGLFQTLLDSLAAEHGARLVATEAANEWLDRKLGAVRRQLSSVRRESATQEVLDIATSAKRRKSRHPFSE